MPDAPEFHKVYGAALRMNVLKVAITCQHQSSSPILQLSRTKLLIRLGKSLFLGSGKATTRVKRRITAAFEGTDLHSASPRGQQMETVLLP